MPWVTKTGVTFINGQMTPYSYKVWVDPKPQYGPPVVYRPDPSNAGKKKPKKKPMYGPPAPTAAQKAAAKKKAELAAAALAKARKAAARRRMWRELNQKAKGIRSTLAGHKPGVAPPGPPSYYGSYYPGAAGGAANAPTGTPEYLAKQKAAKEAAAQQAAHWQGMAKYYKQKQAESDLTKATSKGVKNTAAGAKILERLIKEAREGQKSSGGKDLSRDFVEKVLVAYDEHITKTRDGLVKAGEKLDSFYVRDKHHKIIGWAKGGEKASKAYRESAAFKDLLKEWDRLHGDETKKNDKGSAYYVQTAADQIAASQRKYTYDTAKEAFFKNAEDRNMASLTKKWEDKEQYLYDLAIEHIDPAKTSYMQYYDSKTNTVKSRRRTVEEEFDFRQGQYRSELQREYTEAQNKARLEQISFNEPRAEFNRQKKAEINEPLGAAMQKLGLTENDLKDRNAQINIVDEAMRKWEADNAKWFQNAGGKSGLGIVNGITGKNLMAWQRAKDAQKKKFYDGLNAGQFWAGDVMLRGISTGPIKALTDVLAGGGASIGAGTRVVLKATTGSSTFTIGRDELPANVIHDAYRAQKAAQGTGNIFDSLGRTFQMSGDSMEGYIQKWLSSPEGVAFTKQKEAERNAVSQKQDEAFAEGFYGEGDVWNKLSALSTYGSEVTNLPGVNLVLSLAVDPTIALPLKFTTWPARLQHAITLARETGDTSGVMRAFKAAAEFQRVDESTLRFEKGLAKFNIGPGMKDEMLAELAGIRAKGGGQKAIEKKFRDWGIDPKSTNGNLLMNDASQAIIEKLKAKGVDYRSVAREVQEFEAKRIADEAAAKAAKSSAAEAVDLARKTADEAKLAADTKVRTALNEERQLDIEKQLAKAEVDQLARETEEALAKTAPTPHETRVPGDADGAFFSSQATDPLRQAAREANAWGRQGASTDDMVRRISPEQDTADFIQSVSGHTDTITDHGVEFAATKAVFDFRGTDEYKELVGILDTWDHQNGRIVRTGNIDEVRFGRITAKRAQEARMALANHGRESIYARLREEQSVGRKVPLDEGGKVPFRQNANGVSYQVAGARKSGQQHITTYSETASLGRVRRPCRGDCWQATLGGHGEGPPRGGDHLQEAQGD